MNAPQISLYEPGTILTVGSHHAKIIKYLTSGGFAQVYTAEISPPDPYSNANIACLKRVIVPHKQGLNTLRAEVDAMKLLRNNKHVVSYIDSHAARSVNGIAYEVFVLMEFCERGGLIDFMNTRLQNRLQESEILEIMSQTVQGITAMHALQPPLIHRDIKIENVLISHDGLYKVCDFGSVSGVIRPPRNTQEFNYVQHDILTNTTAQYRSPEMIDLYRGLPIDEKSDIWALGVFLYKICYYTTPFEKSGEAGILHARYQYPSFPQYSDRLKNLIRLMLMEAPSQRPNICQVLEEVSRLQNKPCPIRNFYLLRAMNQNANTQLAGEPSSTTYVPTQKFIPVQSLQSINQPPNMMPVTHVSTTPNLGTFPISINDNNKTEVTAHAGLQVGSHSNLTSPLMKTKSVPLSDEFASLYYKELHPFQKSQTFKSVESFQSPQRKSMPPLSLTPVNNDIFDRVSAINRPNNYVDSETQTIDNMAVPNLKLSPTITSKSLSSTKEIAAPDNINGSKIVRSLSSKLKKVITGESRGNSPIKSRQNTGDSIRSAFGKLRHGFTGNSVNNSRSASFDNNNVNGNGNNTNRRLVSSSTSSFPKFNSDTKRKEESDKNQRLEKRRSMPPSILSDFDQHERNNSRTGSRDYYRSHSPVKKTQASAKTTSKPTLIPDNGNVNINQEKKESIQRRVHNLLKSSDDPVTYKSASGYGKYTDIGTETSNRHSSVRITPITEEKFKKTLKDGVLDIKTKSNGKDKSRPPHPPPKPLHLRTEIQKIRNFSRLQSKKLPIERISSEATETIVDVNVDDLEADFRKRFPSKV
ncbi:AHL_G0026480.mRNA.1.CDS.1 [Saccharomyces cerevisiae]|nr:Prk1p [Saccharomyces cerevisiae YJM1078]AJR37399.1 Prk1p [Saccharomyces cerevisiae YJM248]AJR45213.1 Prk1p [Saccharomyces cerevisiae YJM1252]CAI4384421.1 CPG_1a_G0026500.mRNA.1.CDS.1 [Saccharomyces cerevisiae]CAI4395259.1 AIE_G0026510.mRNA.1.CDS.1 [Saccharomyces cerevisiae]